jgi:hypothetical protein
MKVSDETKGNLILFGIFLGVVVGTLLLSV